MVKILPIRLRLYAMNINPTSELALADSLFCKDIAESPLSFYCSIRVLNNSLTAFIQMLLLKSVDPVSFVVLCIFASLNEPFLF